MSDVGKSNNSDNNIPANKHTTKLRWSQADNYSDEVLTKLCFSQSVTSSPALSRKSKPTTEILEGATGRGSKAGLGFDCDRTYTENEADRVSEDINDMVEQIHAIQQDISQLAGRPISLIDYKQWNLSVSVPRRTVIADSQQYLYYLETVPPLVNTIYYTTRYSPQSMWRACWISSAEIFVIFNTQTSYRVSDL